MKDLIEALTILSKYGDNAENYAPTHCGHDILVICVPKDGVSEEDVARLKELSFTWYSEYGGWSSYRFGSC